MTLTVQKYGGSSLSSPENLLRVARRIVASRRRGEAVVAVVSAMGDTTSELLDLATRLASEPPRRELDLLLSSGEQISTSLVSMAIQELGEEAVALTGPQSGVLTTDNHFDARIREVRPERIERELESGSIPVIAGYQGESSSGEITTLGRGGSDTTAVAIAAALGADCCELNSDVPGVFSADPRIVDDAILLPAISYDDMLLLSRLGAGVINSRAVAYAKKHDVTIKARASFGEGDGTRIENRNGERYPTAAVGVASHRTVVWLRTDSEGRTLLEKLRASLPSAILARQTPAEAAVRGTDTHHALVPTTELPNPEFLEETLRSRFGKAVTTTNGVGSVSVVGGWSNPGSQTRTTAAALSEVGLDAESILSSHSAVTVLVAEREVPRATRALHGEFFRAEEREVAS